MTKAAHDDPDQDLLRDDLSGMNMMQSQLYSLFGLRRTWGFQVFRTYESISSPDGEDSSSASPEAHRASNEEGDSTWQQIYQTIKNEALSQVQDSKIYCRFKLPVRHMPGASMNEIRELLREEHQARRAEEKRCALVDDNDTRLARIEYGLMVDQESARSILAGGDSMFVTLVQHADIPDEMERDFYEDEIPSSEEDEGFRGWVRMTPRSLEQAWLDLIMEDSSTWYGYLLPDEIYDYLTSNWTVRERRAQGAQAATEAEGQS